MTAAQAGWAVLAAARVLPCLLLVPAFGRRRLPLPVVVALALLVGGSLLHASGFSGSCPGGLRWLGLLLKELCVGVVLGAVTSAVFAAVEVGGAWSDQLRGAGRARAFDPGSGQQTSPLAVLHSLMACALFFVSGGPVLCVEALIRSWVRLPIDAAAAGEGIHSAASLVIALVEQAMDTGLWIAMPVLAAILLCDLVLGFLNRTAPQIQVFFLGMPVKAVVGMAAAAFGLYRAAWFMAGWDWGGAF